LPAFARERHSVSKHYPWLDWVRFLAAFEVMLSHARGFFFVDYGSLIASDRTPPVAVFFALTRLGEESVLVFFVISGFLVGGRSIDRMISGQLRLEEYAVDRLVRIMLPLVPALLLTGLVQFVLTRSWDLGGFVGSLLSLQGIWFSPYGGNAPLWSLAYEVWFYIAIYAIGGIVTTRRFGFASAALICCFLMAFTKLDVNYFFCWLMGAAAFFLRPKGCRTSILLAYSSLLAAAVALVEITTASRSVNLRFADLLPTHPVAQLWLASCASLTIRRIITFTPSSSLAFRLNRLGSRLAAFSYTLYLTHYPLLMLCQHLGMGKHSSMTPFSVSYFMIIVSFNVLVAFLIYSLFEKHTDKCKGYLKGMLGLPDYLPGRLKSHLASTGANEAS
jgi:peptidoglycan/LPS O-acetylase OafA/YrhL